MVTAVSKNQPPNAKWFDFTALAVIFLALGIAFLVAHTFSPGFISFDSWRQYAQVIKQDPLNDAHPVIMVYVWRFLQEVFGGPGVMLGLHQLLYWGGLAAFSCMLFRHGWMRLLVVLGVGFCPPLFIASIHVWKDVGMLVGLLWSVVGLIAYNRAGVRRGLRGLATFVVLAGIFYASAVRLNGFVPSALLLAALAALLFIPRVSSLRRGIVLGAVMLALAGSIFGVAMKSLNAEAKHVYALGTLMVWDMVAISINHDTDYIPLYLARLVDTDFLPALREANSREANYKSFRVVSPYPRPEFERQLVNDWFALVRKHPGSYLRHRIHVLKVLMGLNSGPIYYPFHRGIDDNPVGLKFKYMSDAEVQAWLKKFERDANSILYRPWIYAVLGVFSAGLGVTRILRTQGSLALMVISVATALSGLANTAALTFIATAADYRYITWLILASLVAAVILVADIWESRNPAVDLRLNWSLAALGRLVLGAPPK